MLKIYDSWAETIENKSKTVWFQQLFDFFEIIWSNISTPLIVNQRTTTLRRSIVTKWNLPVNFALFASYLVSKLIKRWNGQISPHSLPQPWDPPNYPSLNRKDTPSRVILPHGSPPKWSKLTFVLIRPLGIMV